MRAESLFRAPQRADPFSWFLRFSMPVALAISTAIITVTLIVFGLDVRDPLLSAVGGGCTIVALLLVNRAIRSRRGTRNAVRGIVPYLIAVAGVVLSAFAHANYTQAVTTWTGPLGIAAIVVALVPITPAVGLFSYGIAGALLCGTLALTVVVPHHSDPTIAFTHAIAVVLITTIGCTVYAAILVDRITRWRLLPYDTDSPGDNSSLADHLHEFGAPIVIDDDVKAFLARIAGDGRVTPRDREKALELARSIRADLNRVINRTWLEVMAIERRLSVVDPERLAARMTSEQQSTIRALISSVLDTAVVTDESLVIELRRGDDGATAVAVAVKVNLPEGRRIMMLAPYLVTLGASVDREQLDGGELLRMRFRLPPSEADGRWVAI